MKHGVSTIIVDTEGLKQKPNKIIVLDSSQGSPAHSQASVNQLLVEHDQQGTVLCMVSYRTSKHNIMHCTHMYLVLDSGGLNKRQTKKHSETKKNVSPAQTQASVPDVYAKPLLFSEKTTIYMQQRHWATEFFYIPRVDLPSSSSSNTFAGLGQCRICSFTYIKPLNYES